MRSLEICGVGAGISGEVLARLAEGRHPCQSAADIRNRLDGRTQNMIEESSPWTTGRGPSAYRVQLVPRPIVIDADGLPVPNSHVVEITFPGDTIETALGRLNTIVGAGAAKILVGETTIRGIPLC